MHRFVRMAGIAVVASALVAVSSAQAQLFQVCYPAPVVVAPTPVVTSYYVPPTTVFYTPTVSYAPTVSYYPAAVPTTVYSAPVAYASPGVVSAYTYRGFGIFRPRGFYTSYYYSPGVTSYYTPVFVP